MKNKYLINTKTTLFTSFFNQKKQGDLFIKCYHFFFSNSQVACYKLLSKLKNGPNQQLKCTLLKKLFSTILLLVSITTTITFGQNSVDQSSPVQAAACDTLAVTITAPELSVNQSGCTNTTGLFNVVTACEEGTIIEFSTNEGGSWTTMLPAWEDGLTLIARCRDTINICTSSNSNSVTAKLQVCVEICNNNLDDDGDGAIDCADGDCQVSTSNSVRNETICQGDFYELNGVRYTESGTYTANFANSSGCDSTITLNLTMIPAKIKLINKAICQGSAFEFNGTVYTEAGEYTASFTTESGCDSIVIVTLTTNAAIMDSINAILCQGHVYTLNGKEYTTAGIYTDTLTTTAGCDSILTVNLSAQTSSTSTINKSICQGSSYYFNGASFEETGTYTTTLTNSTGCDSIVHLNLFIKPPKQHTINDIICQDATYTFNENTYTEAGTYTNNFVDEEGCDSIITLQLTTAPNYDIVINDTICQGAVYSFNGVDNTEEGTYISLLTSATGCDSVVILNLSLKPCVDLALTKELALGQSDTIRPEEGINYEICVINEGITDAYNILITDHIPDGLALSTNETKWLVDADNDATYTIPGPLKTATTTCVNIELELSNPVRGFIRNYAEISGVTDDKGVYIDDFDSTPDSDDIIEDLEDDEDFEFIYFEPCPYVLLIPQIDTIYVGDTIAIQAFGGTPEATYLWSNLENISCTNCQSIIVSPKETTAYTYIVTEPTECTARGLYTVVVLSESSLKVDLGADRTVCAETATVLSAGQEALGTYQWTASNGVNIENIANPTIRPTATTDYCVTVTNNNGESKSDCVTIFVNPNSTTILEEQICGNGTYLFNGDTLTANGTYIALLSDANGCDSTITLNLYVAAVQNKEIEQVLCEGDSLFFNDQFITAAGNYQASFNSRHGCDSTVNLLVTKKITLHQQIERTLCEGDTLFFEEQVITQPGNYQATFNTTNGCDSVISLTVLRANTIHQQIEHVLCEGTSLHFNDQIITKAGSYQAISISDTGCDSITTLLVTTIPAKSKQLQQTLCTGASILFDGQIITTAGIYQSTVSNSTGCDSITTLTVTSVACTDMSLQTTLATHQRESIQVGETVDFRICILNEKGATAAQTTLVDLIPEGMSLHENNPGWSLLPNNSATYLLEKPILTGRNRCIDLKLQLDQVSPNINVLTNRIAIIDVRDTSGKELIDMDSSPTNPFPQATSDLEDDENIVYINIDPAPCPTVGTALFPEKTVCTGESVQLDARSGTKWRWQPTTGLDDPQSPTPIATPIVTTAYLVTIWDEQGCITSNGRIVKVEDCEATPPPCTTVAIEVSPDQEICQGEQIQLYVNGGSQQQWRPTIGLDNPASATPIASPSTTTTYTVTIWDGEGCTLTEEVVVKVKECTVPPSSCSDFILYTSADKYICPGGSARLIVNGGIKWQWSPTIGLDNPTSDIPLASPTTTTYYTVVATNEDGCTAEKVVGVLINEPATACEDKTITIGNSTQLSVSDGILYDWSPTTSLDNPYSPSPIATPTVTTTYTVTVTREAGCTSTDEVTVFVKNTRLSNKVALQAKVYLQGAMLPNDALLQDQLRSKNLLPFKEPYTDLVPFEGQPPCFIHIGGGGGEQVASSVFSITGENAIVDWVFIELRAATNPALVVATRAALLQRDGDIVEVDGISNVVFDLPAASYYVAIRHRNHLGAMTKLPIPLSETASSLLDFTNPNQPLYQLNDPRITSNYPMKKVGNARYLWGGNSNGDRRIIYQGPFLDQNKVFFDVYTHPDNVEPNANFIIHDYCLGDNNMDGALKYQGTNNDVDELQFFNVLLHEENPDYLLGKIIYEQIPRE